MDTAKLQERHSKHRKRGTSEQPHDRRAKIAKRTVPLYFSPPLTGSRLPVVDEASKYKVASKTKDLRKESHLQEKDYMPIPSSFRNENREKLRYSYQQDTNGRNCNKKRSFLTAKGLKRPLMVPSLPTRPFPGRVSKQANETSVKTTSNVGQKMFPKYLPEIENRKDLNLVTPETTEAEKTKILHPLAKRTANPFRAAISSSATRRGLITLDLEEQFILRFRLSNYDVKDINIATLNEPV